MFQSSSVVRLANATETPALLALVAQLMASQTFRSTTHFKKVLFYAALRSVTIVEAQGTKSPLILFSLPGKKRSL